MELPPALIQPMAADDVAAAVCEVTLAAPLNNTVEIAGPEPMPFEYFVRQGLRAVGDQRAVVDKRACSDRAGVGRSGEEDALGGADLSSGHLWHRLQRTRPRHRGRRRNRNRLRQRQVQVWKQPR